MLCVLLKNFLLEFYLFIGCGVGSIALWAFQLHGRGCCLAGVKMKPLRWLSLLRSAGSRQRAS